MDTYAFSQIVESQIDIEARPDLYLEQFHKANPVAAYLFVMYWVVGAIAGDGFYFVFEAREGQIFLEAIEGFKRIGMPKTAEILEQAGAQLGIPYPRGIVLRGKRLAKLVSQVPIDSIREKFGFTLDQELDEYDIDILETMVTTVIFEALETTYFQLIDSENDGFHQAAEIYMNQNTYSAGSPKNSLAASKQTSGT